MSANNRNDQSYADFEWRDTKAWLSDIFFGYVLPVGLVALAYLVAQ